MHGRGGGGVGDRGRVAGVVAASLVPVAALVLVVAAAQGSCGRENRRTVGRESNVEAAEPKSVVLGYLVMGFFPFLFPVFIF
jgi:hypothetical protein